MKRIMLVGAAVAALLTAGAPALASAATTTPATTTVKCKLSLATQIPTNDTSVLAGSEEGKQTGKTTCPSPIGKGISHDSFQTSDAGNLFGSIQSWFNNGTVYGSYYLKVQPDLGPPTSTSFGSASYAGTVTFKGGHGALYGVTGKGTMKCSTNDSAHFTCTMRATLKLPAATSTSSAG